MLKFFIGLLLLSGEVLTSDICSKEYSECSSSGIPTEFPESNEELEQICKPSIEFLECEYQYNEVCHPEKLEVDLRNLDFVREICTEDSLLHLVLVDNLKCFKKVVKEGIACPLLRNESMDRLHRYAELLSAEGLVSLTDNEDENSLVYECIEVVNYFACHSLAIEKECGKFATSAFYMMVRKGGPDASDSCKSYEILNAFLRLRKQEEDALKQVESQKHNVYDTLRQNEFYVL